MSLKEKTYLTFLLLSVLTMGYSIGHIEVTPIQGELYAPCE